MTRRRRTRLHDFWASHRRLFWMFHSTWALTSGIAVVFLARERYRLVVWVVVFLALTWASTLYFGRVPGTTGLPVHGAAGSSGIPRLADEVTSYLTRVMYQETLFFLLPFYAYSTVIDSPNVVFMALLGGLAVFSCIDLVFDRWLRTRPIFGLTFFAIVAFGALNLLLPLLFGLRLRFATPTAALLAVAAAVPLGWRTMHGARRVSAGLVVAAVSFVTVAIGFPVLVPPVPLRLQSATFAPNIDPATFAVADTLHSPAPAASIGNSLGVVVQVFAPSALPTQVRLEWRRDGQTVRESRDIEIIADHAGFRVWDAWHPATGAVPPGAYEVVLRTQGTRVFGVAKLRVEGR